MDQFADPSLWLAVTGAVTEFQRALDDHEWDRLASLLADSLYIDYSGLRGRPGEWTTPEAYARARRDALDHLAMQHSHTNLVVTSADDASIEARCNFQIRRFDPEHAGGSHFHSWGVYRFTFRRDTMLISRIEQVLTANEGDPRLHRGVRGEEAPGDGSLPSPG